MNYDWSGVRTRRIAYVKWTSCCLLGATLPVILMVLLRLSH